MNIGYQGIEGSNAEEAAREMAEKIALEHPTFVPLVSSQEVIRKLKEHAIDFAVVAVKNTIGGIVSETFDAIKDERFEIVATKILPIHHCLFKKEKSTPDAALTAVASHIQALKQTEAYRSRVYPSLQAHEIEDTAIGARWLADGTLPATTAVICRKNAGVSRGLHLMAENIEDRKENYTEFRMFRIPDVGYENDEMPTFGERLIYACLNETGMNYIGRAITVAAIMLSFLLVRWFSTWEIASTLGGVISVIFLFLTSNKIRNKIRYDTLTGYWKYYSIPDSKGADTNQRYETPRVVEIKAKDGRLEIKGWICDNTNRPLFCSSQTIVTPAGTEGTLVYQYTNPKELHRDFALNGVVVLNWESKHPAARINRMSGWYLGIATHESGHVEYLRITEKEYGVLKESQFL